MPRGSRKKNKGKQIISFSTTCRAGDCNGECGDKNDDEMHKIDNMMPLSYAPTMSMITM